VKRLRSSNRDLNLVTSPCNLKTSLLRLCNAHCMLIQGSHSFWVKFTQRLSQITVSLRDELSSTSVNV